jgi:hypothetical protein
MRWIWASRASRKSAFFAVSSSGEAVEKKKMSQDEALPLIAIVTQNALVMLAKCFIMNHGALKPGQFCGGLKATFNEPDAEWSRLDYAYFRHLANFKPRYRIGNKSEDVPMHCVRWAIHI